MADRRKCFYCKECLERYFEDGNRIYYCILCDIIYDLVVGEGLVERGKEEGTKDVTTDG